MHDSAYVFAEGNLGSYSGLQWETFPSSSLCNKAQLFREELSHCGIHTTFLSNAAKCEISVVL